MGLESSQRDYGGKTYRYGRNKSRITGATSNTNKDGDQGPNREDYGPSNSHRSHISSGRHSNKSINGNQLGPTNRHGSLDRQPQDVLTIVENATPVSPKILRIPDNSRISADNIVTPKIISTLSVASWSYKSSSIMDPLQAKQAADGLYTIAKKQRKLCGEMFLIQTEK